MLKRYYYPVNPLCAMAAQGMTTVVSLDAFDGLLRVTVILRGDPVPLSIEERFQMNANRTIAPLTILPYKLSLTSHVFFWYPTGRKQIFVPSVEYWSSV
jgi:hypothetical protein